jgi:opacity protein-like surface antigen
MLSGMKRLLVAASAALLLAGASGAAFAQDRASAPVAAPAVWNGQGDANLTTKVDWRRNHWRHDRREWRRDWRHDRRDWRRDHWRNDRWRSQHHDWRWRNHDRRPYRYRWY